MRIIALLLALSTYGVHAQSWFNDEAEWHFAYGNSGAVVGYVHGSIGGDTVLDGLSARKLELHRYASFIGTTQVFEEAVPDRVVRYSDGIVWVHVPALAAFDTLYDMHAVPGQRWRLAELSDASLCGPESYMEVTDTGTTSRYGPDLRWLGVVVHYAGDWSLGVIHDTIVERIGTLGMYILPHDLCLTIVDGGEGGLPLCYKDTEVDYQWDPEIPCDRALRVGSVMPAPSITLGPNPASEWLRMGTSDTGPMRVAVFDAQGRSLLTRTLANPTEPINIAALAAGSYIVCVAQQHRTATLHLVKQ